MKIEADKKNISIKRIITEKTVEFELNEDVIIPDVKPDILKPIKESGNICIYRKEVGDGKIKLDGAVNIYLIYLADSQNENIRSINTNIDFKEIFECKEARDSMCLDERLKIKSIECKVLNGRKISLKIDVSVLLVLYVNEDISMVYKVNNIDDLQKIEKTVNINTIVGRNVAKTYAKETIKLEQTDNLGEILKLDINIINKDTKISYNKILAKADAEIRIMYLTENDIIKNVEEKIPIMGFIELPNISEDDVCDVEYTIRNIIVKPNTDDSNLIYVELEIELTCNAFKQEEISVIEDMYSPSKNLEYEISNVKTLLKKECKCNTLEMKEKLAIQELVGEKIYNISTIPIINSKKILNNKIVLEGDVKIDFIISANNGTTVELITKKLPFVNTIDFDEIDERNRVDVNIDVSIQDYDISDSNINLNYNLYFEVCKYEELNLNIINNVTNNDDICEANPYSMTIYFVKPGDSLWKIAKKYKSTIEDIANLNNITDINSIDVGMQLFIPKYVCARQNG